MLDFTKPVTYGAQTEEDWHFEHKAKQHKALMDSTVVIDRTFAEFKELTGREYKRVESYMMDDAEVGIVAMGSLAMEAIVAADMLREQGHRVGVLGLRIFRPFPKSSLAAALKKCRLIVVFDKNVSYGLEGATCSEVKAALYGGGTNAVIRNFIVGLGGRDVRVKDIVAAVNKALLSLPRGVVNEEYPEWICYI